MQPLVLYAKQINHELHALIGAGKMELTEEDVEENILDETVSHLLYCGPVPGSAVSS